MPQLVQIIFYDPARTCSEDISKDAKYTGNTLSGTNGDLRVDCAEQCRDECKKNDKCVGWVWYSPSSKGNRSKQCWLKKQMKEKESVEGAFTGHCTGTA